jgi:hypothetical protein
VLLLSKTGTGISTALRLADEGHIVKVYLENGSDDTLNGLHNPSRVSDPRRLLEQYDLVLADSAGLGTLCDELRDKGKLVLGGGSFNDKLVDEQYSRKVVNNLLKVGQLRPDLLDIGINLTTEGWFNKTAWLKPFNHSIKARRLMDGDKGPNIGCMGLVLWTTDEDKLTNTLFESLTPLLVKVDYVGPISIKTFVTKKNIYANGFIPYFNVLPIWTELLKQSLFDFLYSLATDKVVDISCHKDYAIGVYLLLASGNTDGAIAIPDEAKRHVWLTNVNKSFACVTARGQTVRECQRRAYRTVSNIVKSKNVMYRNDIGNNVESQYNELKEQGWVN